MYDKKIKLDQVFELRTKTTDYFGLGAIKKINDIAKILSGEGIKKVIIVASKSAYIKTGAWDVIEPALKDNGIDYVIYNKITPNPTDTCVDEATKVGLNFGAQAVIGIGGGSPIDAAKSVAIMIKYPQYTTADLYEFKFTPDSALPIIAINTTHGTGTEVNRFAVVSIEAKEYKPAIAYDCIYPRFSIDDPALMTGLSAEQTVFVSVDALNHVTEAATTSVASPYSIMMANETVKLIAEYLPRVIGNPQDLEARYYLTYASAIAGISFDNGLLHFTHALEHPLSAIKPELAHGLGLAMILPAVVKTIYAAYPERMATLFAPIVPGLNGTPDEAEKIASGIESWLRAVGVSQKLTDEGFTEKHIERLVELAQETPSLDGLLSLAPVKSTAEVIRNIYKSSLKAS
ncbi:MAG: iron-containing alcohol dehydrogenase [Candidatus Cloacimonetes bacterium]|nr:iron-containing alcohol dehydrogenase [Candidatus Cloacimonadota bacterium]